MAVKTESNPNQIITLPIKRLGINGEGIGYYKKKVVFVTGALPDETVKAKITRVTPTFIEAKMIKALKPSKKRVVPPCPFYDRCGGCQLQHLAYEGQLVYKRDVVKQALAKFKPAGYQSYTLHPTIGMENPWRYRNKLQFQIREEHGEVVAGLYEPNSHQLVAIDDCYIQQPTSMSLLNQIIKKIQTIHIPAYNERDHKGILKTVMIREGLASNEIQVVFITHSQHLPKSRVLIDMITSEFPQVVSIMHNVQPTRDSTIMGDVTHHLWGKESIEETLRDVTFDLSARAFFQLNPAQTEVLYKEVEKALNPKQHHHIVDAYCGVGTIGLSLAKKVRGIWGMDIIPSAIDDAKENARRLGVTNTHYEVGTAEALLPKWLKQGQTFDGIIVDPPRTGLDKSLLDALCRYPTPTLVYVSCNPSTLARDLVTLSKFYHVAYLQSVDMFPQTARCEVVVKLTLK